MAQIVQFTEYGGTEVLQLDDVAAPAPGEGQVRLAVRVAGVNPVEWKILQGFMQEIMPVEFPSGLGTDVAGVIDEIGPGVDGWAVGDEVLGTSSTPSYAQVAVADAASLIRKPSAVSWQVAGSIAGAGGTAWSVLDRLAVRAGETLLIHAVAGGVGTFAAQLAVARGVRVIGTAGESNHDHLRSIGVEPVVYGDGLAERVRSIAPNGVDAVIDASGRGEIPLSIDLAGGPDRVLTLVAFDAADTGVQIYIGAGGAPDLQALQGIVDLIEDGTLQVPIARVYSLDRAADAIEASRTGHVRGKIVIEVS